MTPLGISTAYFTLRTPAPKGDQIAGEALALGLRSLELDYRLTLAQLQEMSPSLGRGELEVLSVHHPFPRPPGVDPATAHTRGPLLSSPDRDERKAAVRRGEESIRWAADLGARAVVFHLGAVALPPAVDTRVLEEMVRSGRGETADFEDLRSEVAGERAQRARPHVEAAMLSLDRLGGCALDRGVHLGLENRYHAEEIPNGDELQEFFRVLDGAPLAHWHDTGHAESLYQQGFLPSRLALLERFRGRTAGFHLHDAVGLDDHRAPGEGELDFGELAPWMGEGSLKILEVHPRSPVTALIRGVEILKEAGVA